MAAQGGSSQFSNAKSKRDSDVYFEEINYPNVFNPDPCDMLKMRFLNSWGNTILRIRFLVPLIMRFPE